MTDAIAEAETSEDAPANRVRRVEHKIFNDHFQNYKRHAIPKAQLVIADIPYNLGNNAFASNPAWYEGGDNSNGESKLAGTQFFDTDKDFRISEFLHFCASMLVKEPKETGKSPCMVVFCAFDQQMELIEEAKKHGLNRYINLVFTKNFSAQVLKANMRVVGNCEYGLILYRDKLPKFNNNGRMVFNAMEWPRDNESEKIHPCLPAGENVFFNGRWKKIEDVQIGDRNRYGAVSHITEHYAEKLVEIKCGGNKVVATWNHPFLIKRGGRIYWVNADQISTHDFVLSSVSVYNTQKPQTEGTRSWQSSTEKQQRDISGFPQTKREGSEWSIALFGKNTMARFRLACKYTIKILTRQTTTFPICNLSHPLSTSGCTLVADLSMGYGKSLVACAENIKLAIKRIGISPEAGSTGSCVKNASSKNLLQQERFLLQKVGSVRILNQKTKVYNLTIDGIPAFDTSIGVSHNTQKPIKLLERLIALFTDPGEVVIDPCCGSGSTVIAAARSGRSGYGFEIKKNFHKAACEWLEHEGKQAELFAPVKQQAKQNNAELFTEAA